MNIKEKILNNISDLIDKQNAKGLKKYGHPLEDCPARDYDWQNMIIEELIDALQYQQKQMQESEDEKLELAVANENLLKENRVYKNRIGELEKLQTDSKLNLLNRIHSERNKNDRLRQKVNNIEKEIVNLIAITGSETTSVQLLQSLNKALLAGVEPHRVFNALYVLSEIVLRRVTLNE